MNGKDYLLNKLKSSDLNSLSINNKRRLLSLLGFRVLTKDGRYETYDTWAIRNKDFIGGMKNKKFINQLSKMTSKFPSHPELRKLERLINSSVINFRGGNGAVALTTFTQLPSSINSSLPVFSNATGFNPGSVINLASLLEPIVQTSATMLEVGEEKDILTAQTEQLAQFGPETQAQAQAQPLALSGPEKQAQALDVSISFNKNIHEQKSNLENKVDELVENKTITQQEANFLNNTITSAETLKQKTDEILQKSRDQLKQFDDTIQNSLVNITEFNYNALETIQTLLNSIQTESNNLKDPTLSIEKTDSIISNLEEKITTLKESMSTNENINAIKTTIDKIRETHKTAKNEILKETQKAQEQNVKNAEGIAEDLLQKISDNSDAFTLITSLGFIVSTLIFAYNKKRVASRKDKGEEEGEEGEEVEEGEVGEVVKEEQPTKIYEAISENYISGKLLNVFKSILTELKNNNIDIDKDTSNKVNRLISLLYEKEQKIKESIKILKDINNNLHVINYDINKISEDEKEKYRQLNNKYSSMKFSLEANIVNELKEMGNIINIAKSIADEFELEILHL
jgi:hypothetical protein